MRSPSRWFPWLLILASACGNESTPRDYGDPTSLATPTEQSGIVAWIVSPRVDAPLESAAPEIVVAAHTAEEPYGELRVSIGRLQKNADGLDGEVDMRPARAEGTPGPEQRFALQVPLTHGTNRLIVRIEALGQGRVRRVAYTLDYEGQNPGLRLSVRAPTEAAKGDGDLCKETRELNDAITAEPQVCVSGRVTSASGERLSLTLDVPGGAAASAELGEDGTFALPLGLALDRENVLTARLEGGEGRSTTAEVVVIQDSQPPDLKISTRARETSAPSLELEGTVSDPHGVSAVELRTPDGTAIPAGRGSPWQATVKLALGENPVVVVARDLAGNEAREELTLSRLRTLWLGKPKENAGGTQLELTRADLEELLTVEGQESLSLVQVELRPSIRQALERIREPERFGIDTSAWGAPERNLQRILNMTPDTADLTGTSMEELLSIANAVGLPAPRVLAQLLNLGVTDFIVDPEVAADVLTETLIGTHPNIIEAENGSYVMDVSLYDVFQNLSTLAPRFGPSGAHPGFLEGQSYSVVLEPGFMMTLPVKSNLVQYDALDLSRASKDYFFVLNGDSVLSFDTLTDEFTVVGLKDEPTIDLRIRIAEHPGAEMLMGGTSRYAAEDASYPGFFRGDGEGFAVEPWYLEHASAEIGYRMYFQAFLDSEYKRTLRYDAGSIKDAAVINWDRGWVTITTAGGVGEPPPPMYVWDLLMEVAQVRLHDNGVPEGQAEMAFSLQGLPIGLTAEELVEKLRPRLSEQEEELSKRLVGDSGLAESRADVYYVPAAAGKPGALLFRAASDTEGEYAYDTPGFFSDVALTQKVSSTDAVGGVSETAHEKVPATLGAIYFAKDNEGRVYRIEVAERDGDRAGLRVSEVGGGQ